MERIELESKISEFYKKNHNYLINTQKEDAFQEAVSSIVRKFEKGELPYINLSYIGTCVNFMWKNQMRKENRHDVISMEEFVGSSEDIKFEDIIGGEDKKMNDVVMNIDIETKISEMATRDPEVLSTIQDYIQGLSNKEIAEKFGLSEAVVSKIVNMKTRQERKDRRKAVDLTNLTKIQEIALKYGIAKKSYIKIGKGLSVLPNGRITSGKPYFVKSIKCQNHFWVSYVDEITVEEFENACKITITE